MFFFITLLLCLTIAPLHAMEKDKLTSKDDPQSQSQCIQFLKKVQIELEQRVKNLKYNCLKSDYKSIDSDDSNESEDEGCC